jgi:hypothetical protein
LLDLELLYLNVEVRPSPMLAACKHVNELLADDFMRLSILPFRCSILAFLHLLYLLPMVLHPGTQFRNFPPEIPVLFLQCFIVCQCRHEMFTGFLILVSFIAGSRGRGVITLWSPMGLFRVGTFRILSFRGCIAPREQSNEGLRLDNFIAVFRMRVVTLWLLVGLFCV